MSIAASILAVVFIAWLFYLDHEEHAGSSAALWIPTIWIVLVSSRPVSFWLHIHRGLSLEDQYTEGSPLDAAVYAILILAASFVLNRRWPRVRQFLMANLPLLLFFTYCGLSVLWADTPVVACKRWIKTVGEFLIVLVVLTDPMPRLALKRVFSILGFTLLPLSFLFVYAFPSMGRTYDPISHMTYLAGVATYKNQLGVMCMFCGLGGLWQFIGAYRDRTMAHRARHLLAQGLVFGMAVLLTWRADSMTSLSSTLLAAAVMVACSTSWVRQKSTAVFLLVSSSVGVAAFALFADASGRFVQSLGRDPTLTGRTQIWAAVLAQKINPIIGTGFASFWTGDRLLNVWGLSQKGIEEAHNGYLEVYVNLGWIGVAFLGVVIVCGCFNAVALFRADAQAGLLRIALLTATLVFVLTEAGFRMMSPDSIAFLISVTAVPLAIPDPADTRFRATWRASNRRIGFKVLQ